MPYSERLAEAYIQAASKQREEAGSSTTGQPLNPALQETAKRLGEQVPNVKVPDPNFLQDSKDRRVAEQDRRVAEQDRRVAEQDRRIAELEQQTDKAFGGEFAKKLIPAAAGAMVGSRFGPWGMAAGALIGAAAEGVKRSTGEDPLNELPEQSNGLGRYIP